MFAGLQRCKAKLVFSLQRRNVLETSRTRLFLTVRSWTLTSHMLSEACRVWGVAYGFSAISEHFYVWMFPLQFSYIGIALNHNNSFLQLFVENHLPFLYWTKCTSLSVADTERAQTLHPAFLSFCNCSCCDKGRLALLPKDTVCQSKKMSHHGKVIWLNRITPVMKQKLEHLSLQRINTERCEAPET